MMREHTWISVEDDLPDEWELVAVLVLEKLMSGQYQLTTACLTHNEFAMDVWVKDNLELNNVHYWYPLPEIPEGPNP